MQKLPCGVAADSKEKDVKVNRYVDRQAKTAMMIRVRVFAGVCIQHSFKLKGRSECDASGIRIIGYFDIKETKIELNKFSLAVLKNVENKVHP